ncbi:MULTISPECIES: hypothetical protein [unclassified Cryobacterium]|uniref:hypothetical protein n=1 Tax=unclassified Cryobacterium TaxID=2649013 RepID=UPI0014459A9B|nr:MULTISPECIES: hypothetical protein [unclassified Cryobacterium]
MSHPVEVNTLGTVVGKRGRPRNISNSPAARALRKAATGGASLGTGYLGIGAGIIAGLQAVFALGFFLTRIDTYPNLIPISLAWVLFFVTTIAVGMVIALAGERMPGWLFAVLLAAMGGVIVLDFAAIGPLLNIGATATASVSASFGLLLAVTLRPALELVLAGSAIAVAFVVAILSTTQLTVETIPAQLGVLLLVLLPPFFGSWLVAQFRRMVQIELDRVLVQSTVSAPRLAVGMLASEELARLDLAAEELFDSVASGRTKLPLDPATASRAASLATELRLHLIEGRRETWLYHAITESEQLGRSVTLTDPNSLAGLLDAGERDGLLAAVWLLVSDKGKKKPTVHLQLGPLAAPDPDAQTRTITIPIVISTTGVSRNRVEPATWSAIERVGRFTTTIENSSLRVEINCSVVAPSDQYHAEQAVQR